jgi:methyl-accepting chemotaxis protein
LVPLQHEHTVIAMNPITIKFRMIAIFSLVLVSQCAAGALSIFQIAAINDAASVIASDVVGIEQLYRARTLLLESNISFEKALAEKPGTNRDALLATANSKRDLSISEWKKYDQTCDPGEERTDADKVDALWTSYADAVKAAGVGNRDDASGSDNSAVQLGFVMTTAMQANIDYQARQAHGSIQDASSIASRARILVGSVLSMTLVASLVLAFSLLRSVVRPIGLLTAAMKRLANKDLDASIPGAQRRDELGAMAKAVEIFKMAAVENARLEREAAESTARADTERARNQEAQRVAIEDERAIVAASIGAALSKLASKDLTYRMPAEIPDAYRKLQADFNAAIKQLEEAMQAVVGSADSIQSGTSEISRASDDLSHRTEQQAASLEETAAALDQVSATMKKSAEGAAHARDVVEAADSDAKRSASVVNQTVEAMDAIAKSSEQVGQIISVIDEIAFQTNLLALNAGVEAARAGDAGRGFAVVASEVRALAQRSADAAKEIKELISKSSEQVSTGVKLVAETGAALQRILAQVGDINGVVNDIAAAAKEQATGLSEINSAINEMDKVTQQNAAMVEESTAASHALSDETSQLSAMIGQFRVGSVANDSAKRAALRTGRSPQNRAAPKLLEAANGTRAARR